MKRPNVVDSSGWLEYFADTERASLTAAAIKDTDRLTVPVPSMRSSRERGENAALQIASMMQTGRVVDLDCSLALDAARHPLPLADSLIYATAINHKAILWTQDEHFKDLSDVRFFQK